MYHYPINTSHTIFMEISKRSRKYIPLLLLIIIAVSVTTSCRSRKSRSMSKHADAKEAPKQTSKFSEADVADAIAVSYTHLDVYKRQLLALCIAFDIRDMHADAQKDIQTLPNRIGAARSYVLIDVSIIIFAVSSIVQYLRYPHLGRLIAEVITAVCMKLVMLYVKKHPSDKAYLGLVDGMMLLLSLIHICSLVCLYRLCFGLQRKNK